MRTLKFALNVFTSKTRLHLFCNQVRYLHNQFVPLFANAPQFAEKIAVKDYSGNHTYGDIYNSARGLSLEISKRLHGKINERVLFLCSNDVNYVITLWAIWMSGQIGKLNFLVPKKLLKISYSQYII